MRRAAVAVALLSALGCGRDTPAFHAGHGPSLLAAALGLDHPPSGRDAFVYALVGSPAQPHDTLYVFDVRDPDQPRFVGLTETVATPGPITVAPLAHALALLAGRELVALDVSRPLSPREAGRVTLPAPPTSLVAGGHVAYVSMETAGLLAVDLAPPSAPRPLSIATGPYSAGAADLDARAERLALVGSAPGGANGVWLLDVHDPSHMRALGAVETAHGETHLCVAYSGDRVYVTGDGSTAPSGGSGIVLDVVDASRPSAPSLLGFVPEHGLVDAWAQPAGVLVRIPGAWNAYGARDFRPMAELVAVPEEDGIEATPSVPVAVRGTVPYDAGIFWSGDRLYVPVAEPGGVRLQVYTVKPDMTLVSRGLAHAGRPGAAPGAAPTATRILTSAAAYSP